MQPASKHVQPSDLGFFATLAGSGSLTAAARELGISTPGVSKRLSQMEARLGVALVNRTTRRMSMTPEGDLYLEHARRILGDIDALSELLGSAKVTPTGLVRVNATLGFGRSAIAPIVSKFVRKYPEVEVQLQLSVNPPLAVDDAFDVCVRFGEPPDSRVIARRLAANQRILCAAPAYLARRERPKTPRDLAVHNCIGIRQGDDAFGVWRLSSGRGEHRRTDSVRVRGNLVTNDGEIAVKWALEGHGIVMRAHWDVAAFLRSGRLVQVLPNFQTPDADIFAVYPQRLQHSARVRAFVDFLAESLSAR
ncbi:MAG: LysR family transcriptional regulator [Pseudomonadota bacterium]|nr:LysR family transcriptional regulator [Pseudomonadota bacterium]